MGSRVWGLGLRAQGLGLRVQGLGFKAWGSGLRVRDRFGASSLGLYGLDLAGFRA